MTGIGKTKRRATTALLLLMLGGAATAAIWRNELYWIVTSKKVHRDYETERGFSSVHRWREGDPDWDAIFDVGLAHGRSKLWDKETGFLTRREDYKMGQFIRLDVWSPSGKHITTDELPETADSSLDQTIPSAPWLD